MCICILKNGNLFFLYYKDHIKRKLFAIKSTKTVGLNQQDKSISNMTNEHNVQFDIYYPDNYVPKTLRSVPDFRIIVFEYEN